MGKTGRPTKDEGEQTTKDTRIFVEMWEQIADIQLVLKKTSAQILQDVGGSDLGELHDHLKPQIERAKILNEKAAEEMQKVRDEASKLANKRAVKAASSPRK